MIAASHHTVSVSRTRVSTTPRVLTKNPDLPASVAINSQVYTRYITALVSHTMCIVMLRSQNKQKNVCKNTVQMFHVSRAKKVVKRFARLRVA